MELTEEQYLVLAQSGDTEAFGMLISPYEQKIYLTCLRMLNSNHLDAEDMTQETFIKAWKHINQFKGNSSFSTWLYRIAINNCLSFHRKRKRNQEISLSQLSNDGMQFKDDSNFEQSFVDKVVLNQALSSLRKEYRAMIILRDIQGLSYEEISKIMACPVGTVCSRINRARNEMLRLLQEL